MDLVTTTTQTPHPHPSTPGPDTLSTIPGQRAGFDRLVFSAARRSDYFAARLSADSFRSLLTNYGKPWDYEPKPGRSIYRRCAEFHHASDDAAAVVEIFHKPPRKPVPAFQLAFRAPSRRVLLDIDAVELLVVAFTPDFGPFTVAEVELTFDRPGDAATARQLSEQLYPFRTRKPRKTMGEASWAWANGNSATRFRVYCKPEDGLQLARTECNLRRDALRPLKITTMADLRAAEWSNVARRRFRFVEFQRTARRDAATQHRFQQTVRAKGVKAALEEFSEDRRWVRNRLRPSDTQDQLDNCLRSLEAQLRAA